MALAGIQILGLLFGVFMIYLTFLNYKRRQFTIKEQIFWIVFWLALMFVALFPNSLDVLVKDILNLSRPLDFFIISGFLFLIGAVFYTYTIVRRLQKKMEDIVRQVALDGKKK
ncbi:DUF2304 domain-containing protein [Candidatus Woesearchaeota archaeon]|nr:DUF2304 domain-containing protein [Candidatus Woesearchaeota archaeon]